MAKLGMAKIGIQSLISAPAASFYYPGGSPVSGRQGGFITTSRPVVGPGAHYAMDPDACTRRIIHAARDGDVEDLHDALADLREWVHRGGFLPDQENLAALAVAVLLAADLAVEVTPAAPMVVEP